MDRGRGRGRGGPDRGRGSSRGRSSSRGSSPEYSRGRGRGGPLPVQIFSPPGAAARMDPRLADRDIDSMISGLKKLNVKPETRVVRQGFGKKGTEIAVRANFFEIKYPNNAILYDYPIEIDPPVKLEEKRLRKRLFQLFDVSPAVKPFFGGIAHDGAQRLIATRPLPPTFSPIVINFYEEGQEGPRPDGKVYTITVLEPRQLRSSDLLKYLEGKDPDYDPLPIVSAFNLVTTAYATRTGVLFGKNRYFYPSASFGEQQKFLGPGLEAWKGFYSSVRPVFKSLMVNVNVCMSAFYSPAQNLADAWLDFSRQSYGASPAVFYRRVRVTTSYLGYKKKNGIKGFGPKTAKQTFFQCDEFGKSISVQEYFQRKHRIVLKHADDVPVVNLGNKTKDVYVPAELCEIPAGQSYTGALSEFETASMIRHACNPPYENASAIVGSGLDLLGLRGQEDPLKGFNVQVSSDMAVVPARVLRAPNLMYGNGPQQGVQNGFWNIVNVKFAKPATMTRIAIVVITDGRGRDDFTGANDPALRDIVGRLLDKCRSCGMTVDSLASVQPPIFLTAGRPDPRDRLRRGLIEELERGLKTLPGKPNMVLVFMSARDNDIYPGFKKLFDTKLGVPSLCMLMPRVRKPNGQDQYFSNIALKLNAKLGGLNHRLDENSLRWLKGTMLVGMDVTHPAIGCVKGTQSIAAVVASCDGDFMQYPASLRMHDHREEMIQHVEGMMIERLKEYEKRNSKLPERVLVFRDGVSEGQFKLVLKHELPGIKKALSAVKCKAKLSISICGKRHHTRFYPMRTEEADRTSNTKAGTVVDKGVTSVYDFDFYLQAHSGLQGTVKSTHYTVIYDENSIPADDIQQGVNDLSYLWARATRSVSLVPPAYWADRACERARMYLHGIYPPLEGSPEKRMDEKQIIQEAERLWGNGVHESLRHTMFYL